MPSFDVSAEINWQNLDDAINQTLREVQTRFDFKNIKTEIKLNQKERNLVITCSEAYKMDAVKDVLHQKLAKRGVSIFAIDFVNATEEATGSSGRLKANVVSGISKEKGKEIVKKLKETKLKVQAQIQDEKVRVNGKKRDDLQEAIAYLKQEQAGLKVPLVFENFRE
ncbi:YajQ family cyclic di-GMP-binding protein [bacterium]|nr:YajQ family cyclic di-GMP-binding protein [bacterium]